MKKFLFILLFLLTISSTCFAVEITSPHAILIDMDTGRILYQKNAHEATYPASTTKILTAILTLENCDLDEMVTASRTAVNSVYAGGTTASIQPGEVLSVRDLLSTMMVHSANDAAYVIAEHIGGSTASFASMMNSRAKELGAKDTYFVNPNGLPSEEHKCSVYDMALFARYAMQNFEFFREIVKTVNYTLPITEKYTEFYMNQYPDATVPIRYLTTTTNRIINPNRSEYYEYAIGIKTGYTDAAKSCLVCGAEKDGVRLISVIFGASGWANLRTDTVSLLEYGFDALKSENLAIAGSIIDTTIISNGEKENNILQLVIKDNLDATIHKMEDIKNATKTITLSEDLKAPIKAGSTVGSITYELNGMTYTSDLIAGNSIEAQVPVTETVKKIAKNTAVIVIKTVMWSVIVISALFIALVFLRAYVLTKRQKQRTRRRIMYNARFR